MKLLNLSPTQQPLAEWWVVGPNRASLVFTDCTITYHRSELAELYAGVPKIRYRASRQNVIELGEYK